MTNSIETDDKPGPLEVAQQIVDQFEPGPTVASWRKVEDQANVVELQFTDGTHRKLVGLFAWHILNAAAGMRASEVRINGDYSL